MEKTENLIREVSILKDIICDSCGESCLVSAHVVDNEAHPDYGKVNREYSYITLSGNFGFYSGKDGYSYKAHVCEKCVDEKLNFINFDKKFNL